MTPISRSSRKRAFNPVTALSGKKVVAKKSFGQNFLIDQDILRRIVEAIESIGCRNLIEIGPGTGVLTTELVKFADRFIAVEYDRDMIAGLERLVVDDKKLTQQKEGYRIKDPSWIPESQMVLLNADILDFHASSDFTPYHLVGNIPYNLTTKLFEKIIQWEHLPAAITFLVQKEVAEKIAKKDGKNSTLALCAEMIGEAKVLFDVPPKSFYPAPKVMSSVIQIKNQKSKIKNEEQEQVSSFKFQAKNAERESENIHLTKVDSPAPEQNEWYGAGGCSTPKSRYELYDFAHKVFRNPRKTLLNNVTGMVGDREKATAIIQQAGLDPMIRPERLTMEEILRLQG